MRPRKIDPASHQITHHGGIDAFCHAGTTPSGINVIDHGGLPIDVMNVPIAGTDTTVVMLHGAMKEDVRLPVLSGLGLTRDLPASRIFISDPSLVLSEKMTLGWYAGNSYQPQLQTELSRIVAKVFRDHGSKQLIFFGGSGAGFAGLRLAAGIAGAKVLLWNAQTDIAKYGASSVRRFAQEAFQIDPYEYDPLALVPESVTLNVCPLYASPTGVSVAYMQNTSDVLHIERHLKPFMRTLHPDNDVQLLADDWGEGHTPPPKALLGPVLNAVATRGWAEGLEQFGFVKTSPGTIEAAI